jgi:hypothetical protein
VKIKWISMLSPTKRVMVECKKLLVKMALENPTNQWAKLNYENLCDLQVLLRLACILNMSMPSSNLHK